jgi:hypothetical protein
MTVGEMMAHFKIKDEYYASFTSWVSKNAKQCLMPNESRNAYRRYDVNKIAMLYPFKHQFDSADKASEIFTAAEMLAEAITNKTGKNVSANELLRKYRTVTNQEEFRKMITELYEKMVNQAVFVDQCSKVFHRSTKIAYLVFIGVAIVNLIIQLFV